MLPAPSSHPSRFLGCTICRRPANLRDRWFIYGQPVCGTCHRRFVARRFLALIADYVILVLLVHLASCYVDPLVNQWIRWPRLISLILLLVFPFKDGVAGRSPGKWLFGLIVVESGSARPAGFWRSFKRNVALAIPGLNVLVAVIIAADIWWGHPRLGDTAARTRVIWRKHAYKRPFAPPGPCCPNCGYNLTGNVSGRCPECGEPVPGQDPEQAGEWK